MDVHDSTIDQTLIQNKKQIYYIAISSWPIDLTGCYQQFMAA